MLGRNVLAVDNISLEIAPGEVLGLAGPNGAGKSTLIALLLGFLRPSSGTVRIDGLVPRRYIEREGIGYLSELVTINPRWRAEHALERFALLAGVPPSQVGARVDTVVTRLGLEEHRRKTVRQLSKGTLQRLGLAQAMLREERLVVLDEPTHGLDPLWTQRFRDVVADLRGSDRAVLIASHNLDELQRLADRVAIIDRGRLQRVVTTTAAVPSLAGYRLWMASGGELVAAVFPRARPAGDGQFELPGIDAAALNTGLAELLARGALLGGLTPLRSSLEHEFREAVREPMT